MFVAVKAFWLSILVFLLVWFLNFNSRASEFFQFGSNGTENTSWFKADPMSYTGFLFVIIGLGYSVMVDRSKTAAIARWEDTGILHLDPNGRTAIKSKLLRIEVASISLFVLISVAATAIGYHNFYIGHIEFWTLVASEFGVASFISALLVAIRLGRLVSIGFIGSLLRKNHARIVAMIHHPDRAGGLAQIGNFYLLQVSVLAIPAIWLLVWLFALPFREGYLDWLDLFVILLAITTMAAITAFFVPMISFRSLINEWKLCILHPEKSRAKREMFELLDRTDLTVAQLHRRRELVLYVHELNSIPSWPFSRGTGSKAITAFLMPLLVGLIVYGFEMILTLTE